MSDPMDGAGMWHGDNAPDEPSRPSLAGFYAARLDELEAVAKAAQMRFPSPWSHAVGHGSPLPSAVSLYDAQDGSVAVIRGSYAAAFIARHDPARALREVEAGRRILARYEDCLARMERPAYPHAVARDQAREYEDFMLPNLAAAWSDHPDYDENWRP